MESILQDFFTNITQRIENLEKNYLTLFDERFQIAGIATRLKVVEEDVNKFKENHDGSPKKTKTIDGSSTSPTNKKLNNVVQAKPTNTLTNANTIISTNLSVSANTSKTPQKQSNELVEEEKDVITPDDMDLTTNEDDITEEDSNPGEPSWQDVEAIESTIVEDDIALSDVDEPPLTQESRNVEGNIESTNEERNSAQESCQNAKNKNGSSDGEPPFIIPFPLSVKNEEANKHTQQLATKIARRERSRESAAVEIPIVELEVPKHLKNRNCKDGYFWNQCYVRCIVCSKKVCPGWNGYGEDLDKAIIWHANKAHKIRELEAKTWKKTMFVHTCLLCNKKLAFMLNPIITHINEAHDMALKKYEDQFYEQLESIFNEKSEDKSMPKSLLQAKAQRQQMREKVIDID